MSDVLFDFFAEDMSLDIVVKNGEIQKDESLKSAILISLFTDARCEITELPTGESERSGFWGDAVFGDKIGSKLWLLKRAKYSNDTLIQAKQYAQDALKWLITDGLVKDIQVEVSYDQKKGMDLKITIINKNNETNLIHLGNIMGNV